MDVAQVLYYVISDSLWTIHPIHTVLSSAQQNKIVFPNMCHCLSPLTVSSSWYRYFYIVIYPRVDRPMDNECGCNFDRTTVALPTFSLHSFLFIFVTDCIQIQSPSSRESNAIRTNFFYYRNWISTHATFAAQPNNAITGRCIAATINMRIVIDIWNSYMNECTNHSFISLYLHLLTAQIYPIKAISITRQIACVCFRFRNKGEIIYTWYWWIITTSIWICKEALWLCLLQLLWGSYSFHHLLNNYVGTEFWQPSV